MSHSAYETLRHFADSWGLLFMTASFLAFILWALRPGARHLHDDAAHSIFKDDDHV